MGTPRCAAQYAIGLLVTIRSVKTSRALPPAPLQWAGVIAIAQSAFALVYAVLLLVREITGVEDESIVYESEDANTAVGLGTAIFFIIVFGTVAWAAIMMMRGRRWGRGPVVMLEMLLVPIAFYMFSGGAIVLGVITLVTSVVGLVLVFTPASVQWVARQYNPDNQ